MKFLILVFMSMVAPHASGAYDCRTQDGETKLEIGGSWQTGSMARLSSETVKDFYLLKYGVSVKTLKTVLDPDTRRAVSEVETNIFGQTVYKFMQHDSSGSFGTVWGLEFNSALSLAVLTDQEGKRFQWALDCKTTGDLE
jgi:hypothetical protein